MFLITDLEEDPRLRRPLGNPHFEAPTRSSFPSLPRGCPVVVMNWNWKVGEIRSVLSRDLQAPITSPSCAVVGLGLRQPVGVAFQTAVNQAFGVLAVNNLHLKDFSLLATYRN